MIPRQVLLVEPDPDLREMVATALARFVPVDAHDNFETARERLATTRYQLVVTNVRLQEYNGIHLAYAVQEIHPDTRVVVYADERDLGVAVEAQRACAFFELIQRIPVALPAYLTSALPMRDRRDPARFDRRRLARGGRRLWDLHSAAAIG